MYMSMCLSCVCQYPWEDIRPPGAGVQVIVSHLMRVLGTELRLVGRRSMCSQLLSHLNGSIGEGKKYQKDFWNLLKEEGEKPNNILVWRKWRDVPCSWVGGINTVKWPFYHKQSTDSMHREVLSQLGIQTIKQTVEHWRGGWQLRAFFFCRSSEFSSQHPYQVAHNHLNCSLKGSTTVSPTKHTHTQNTLASQNLPYVTVITC